MYEEQLTERLTILMTPADKRRLRVAAVLMEVSMTDIIRLGTLAIVDATLNVKKLGRREER